MVAYFMNPRSMKKAKHFFIPILCSLIGHMTQNHDFVTAWRSPAKLGSEKSPRSFVLYLVSLFLTAMELTDEQLTGDHSRSQHKSGALGDDARLAVCPPPHRGEEKTTGSPACFFRGCPRRFIILLVWVDHKDSKAPSQQADELWALHDSHSETMAAMQSDGIECDFVAAVRSGKRRCGDGGWSNRRPGNRGRGGRDSGWPTNAHEEPEASRQAHLAAGLCLKHRNGGAWGN
jgi:hypothetical protein